MRDQQPSIFSNGELKRLNRLTEHRTEEHTKRGWCKLMKDTDPSYRTFYKFYKIGIFIKNGYTEHNKQPTILYTINQTRHYDALTLHEPFRETFDSVMQYYLATYAIRIFEPEPKNLSIKDLREETHRKDAL